ncbi:TetR/AcrR family transcriptional regulator [Pseudonocardia lacus]|uniref:TetR/AcrR family transcriptional regulator n=1 Tax=Pseudonocardia lacus TaxID=2835865 RepID=UPI0027E261CE|nr:TetR/AcrR family transcriptional regulator [Pseudonocardia lacus]
MDRARPPRRRDAVETRERILRVAAACSGPLSFDEIALRAGVSRATVYRHFPHRQALGAAVAERGFAALRRALARRERPVFRDLLHAVLATVASLGWVVDLDEVAERRRHRHRRTLIAVLTPAFRQAQADGELRGDVEPADLEPILRALTAAAREPDGPVAARRLLAVLIDGLFVHRPVDTDIDAPRPTCAWAERARA